MSWRKKLKTEYPGLRRAALACALFSLFSTVYCVRQPPVQPLKGWSYKYEPGKTADETWRPAASLMNPEGRRGRKLLLLRVRLPEKTEGLSIFVPYTFTSLEIARSEPEGGIKRGFLGLYWRLLDLRARDGGRLLYLRIHSDYHFIGVTGDVLLGKRSDLILRILRRDLDRFALAVLYVFLSLTAFYLYLRRRTRREFLAFAIFVLSVAFYTSFYTRGLQLFIHQPELLAGGWLFSLFVMPATVAWFMELLFGPGPWRILFWMRAAILTYGVIAFGLIMTNLAHPLKARLPLFALMICSIIAAVIVLVGAIRRGDVNARIFLVGFSALAGIALLDVNLALFIADSSERPRPMSHLGMFAFALALMYILGRRFAETYRDLERRSRELEEARDKLAGHADELEHKVREATEALRADLEMAMHVQSRVLPAEPPGVRGWDIAFHYEAAMGVSGDFYDFFTRGDELLGAGIFDVSGHGTASGLITILTRSIVHRHFRALESEPLGRVMTAVNEELMAELERVDNFVTGVLARTTGDGVDCVLAGHTRPFIKRAGGEVETIGGGPDDPRGSILGSRYARSEYRAMSRKLNSGDVLLLYTDALIESTDDDLEPFQTRRLRKTLKGLTSDLNAREILANLLDRLRTHTGSMSLHDDLTIIVLKKT